MRSLARFLKQTHGLTTIEWVVLCAAVLMAALGISSAVLGGATELGSAVTDQMTTAADVVDN